MRPSIASIEYSFERLPYHKASTFCSNMSKNAQAECKAKTCFQTLLRRSRFSKRSLKERASRMQSENLFSDFAEAQPFFET